jgi:hypothetical protein
MRSDEPGTASLIRDAAGWPMIRLAFTAGEPAEIMLTARQANTLGEHLINLADQACEATPT